MPVQPQPPQAPPPVDMTSILRRLKILEEALENARRKADLDERSRLESQRKQTADIKTFGEEITQLRREVKSIKDNVQLIIEELRETAKANDVKVLQKYIDLWTPVNFVTPAQVERIVQDVLRRANNFK